MLCVISFDDPCIFYFSSIHCFENKKTSPTLMVLGLRFYSVSCFILNFSPLPVSGALLPASVVFPTIFNYLFHPD